MSLPANLPNIANAKLPKTYESAKTALAECSRLDECKDWVDKAEALASYAKQAGDESLRKTADRIQARAIQRCSQLLQAIPRPDKGGRPPGNGRGAPTVSRRQAAKAAGLSKDQQITAVRVGRIPAAEFEAAVESDDPPTVTALARRGKASKPLVDLGGRDPHEYAMATQALGHLRRFAEFVEHADAKIVVRGAKPHEYKAMAQHVKRIGAWLDRLARLLEKEKA